MGGDASLNASGPKDTTTCDGPKDAQRDGRRLGRRTKQPPDGGVPNPDQADDPRSTRPSSN
ncbi:hypothetical protein NEUTE1DRAFT_98660 [Neurospora tetrasperma FGSC 2508]|uniref:Uncharacterized protein n=1 Tax=Neurospora tetrasperma (strain FGSC 2508 / ATCC MYA-4615 / P0657) TaxID=510951 RepID=F8ME37_NEUT8|nr:uncharacterized protein NEUTE1DRAFT_98660 [Neurospora tetrasperma FGSC 2508]EGO61572.1 hypothetical protein NEUTE1DRAFT_98660 [Neurospora tetrasperma FGSC 2508]